MKHKLNVIPILPGDKKPVIPWGTFQTRLYNGPMDIFTGGIAVVSGGVSGGLVVLDVDGGDSVMREFCDLLLQRKEDILDNMVIEQSPSKGYHLAYRCRGLSEYPSEVWKRGGKTILEMRGDSHYTVISPTPRYKLLRGDWLELPLLTPDEHDLIISVGRQLDESPSSRRVVQAVVEEEPRDAGGRKGNIDGPTGTDVKYLLEQDAPRKILKSMGCVFMKSSTCKNPRFQFGQPVEYWRRGGKNDNSHAIGYFPNNGVTFCFSSNVYPLKENNGYTPIDLFSTVVMGTHISMQDGNSHTRRSAVRTAAMAIRRGAWRDFENRGNINKNNESFIYNRKEMVYGR